VPGPFPDFPMTKREKPWERGWEWENAGISVNEFFLKFLAKERVKYVLKGNPLYCNDLDESVGVHGFFINNQYYN
jgi:hypothetical protein